MKRLALDTSAAVPFLLSSHPAHRWLRDELSAEGLVLTGHSLAETYSVLTRLPGDARVAPRDVVALLDDAFSEALIPHTASATGLASHFASLGIMGGAVYDGLVALAARDGDAALATRDVRALPTYASWGVDVRLLER